jgi:hypothetical protein
VNYAAALFAIALTAAIVRKKSRVQINPKASIKEGMGTYRYYVP